MFSPLIFYLTSSKNQVINAVMDLENVLSAHENEDLGFLCNSLANKGNLCLMNFRALAGSGSVMNEAKQFSRSISGQ